jgi:hypothetical protein
MGGAREKVMRCDVCHLDGDIVGECIECSDSICASCEKAHSKYMPGHDVISIDKIAERLQSMKQADFGECKGTLLTSNKSREQMGLDISWNRSKLNSAINSLNNCRKMFIDTINQEHDKVITKLEEDVRARNQEISKKMNNLKSHTDSIMDLSSKLQKMKDRKASGLVLVEASDLSNKVRIGKKFVL